MKMAMTIIAAALCCTQAKAETIPVAGIYAAGANIDPVIDTIALEGFGGDAGPELSFLLSDLLQLPRIEGDPWFRVVPAATLGSQMANASFRQHFDDVGKAEQKTPPNTIAIMRGSARSAIADYAVEPRKRKKCVKKVDGDCVERKTIAYQCRALTVEFIPMLRLITPDGELIFEDLDHLETTREYCEDDRGEPSANHFLALLVQQYAESIQLRLAPRHQMDKIRVLEGRKGLSKADARRFKAAVRMTKSDPGAACAGFMDLETGNPQNVPILVNIGLCHESKGQLEAARHYYLRAASVAPDNNAIDSGLTRITSRFAAQRQIATRYNSW